MNIEKIMEEMKMKKILKRVVKFTLNEMRKVLAILTKNRNLKTNSYLYDMAILLRNDLGVTRRNGQYVLHIGNNPICILDEKIAILVLDRDRFEKIKINIIKIGNTPRVAYKNIDTLFESKLRNGRKPTAVTIKR